MGLSNLTSFPPNWGWAWIKFLLHFSMWGWAWAYSQKAQFPLSPGILIFAADDQSPPNQIDHGPLHIAASGGNTQFAMEIASLKPSLAWKPNLHGLRAMQLALPNCHQQLARTLPTINRELVQVKGEGQLLFCTMQQIKWRIWVFCWIFSVLAHLLYKI